ncbi:glycosyltransferase family 4 protein [Halobacteria archaeon HArc-gm2]|nr:glycosyltransferase family 4 protein [Halobacteria archaeon HArc-gm2]
MRILRVAQHLYPDTKGGGQYHVHAMSRDQAAMGHDVTVLTTRVDADQPRIEETDGYTVVRVPKGVTVAGNQISLSVARYLWGAGSEEFDVIHAHSHLYFSTNLAALKRRFEDIPLAITNHGLYSQSAPQWVFGWYLKTLGRWTFNQADVVFCYTDTDRERVRDLGVTSRIEVVSNGIDTDRFTPDGPTSELIAADGPIVLFVGRLVEGKRPEDAIRAASQVRGRRSDVELYLCGDGPLRDEVVELAGELEIDDATHFLGHIPYDEMPKVYRSGDVLILPSRAEGVPRTVLEAMASNVPVISSRLEQTAGIVECSGETVEIGNVEGYAASLERLLAADSTREQSSRQTVTSEYNWERTVRRTTDHLLELL